MASSSSAIADDTEINDINAFQLVTGEIKHVQAIKIDVETFEAHVIDGAMGLLCNYIVDMIIKEVECIRPNPKTVGKSVKMQEILEKMGFSILSELKRTAEPS